MIDDQLAGFGEGFQQPKTFITKLIMINTKQKREMVQRSYHLNVSNRDYNELNGIINQFGKVTPEHIANVTPNIMQMNISPDLKVNIKNGWNMERFIFIIEARTQRHDGSTIVSYIQGYTDHIGVDRNNNIDPNMTFYVNSIINMIEVMNQSTGALMQRPHSAFTLVYDRDGSASMQFNNNMFKLLRPIDVMLEMHISNTYQEQGIPVKNTIGTVGANVNTSKADNRLPAKQISSIINSAINSASVAGDVSDRGDIFMAATATLNENSISDVPLLNELGMIYGRNVGEFDFNALMNVDPNVTRVMDVRWTIADQVNLTPQDLTSNDQNILLTNDPETLAVSTPEARIASQISETCSGIMESTLLTNIMFQYQYGIINTQHIFTPLNYNSIIPILNLEAAVMEFESNFIAMVAPQITQNGMLGVDILVNIDLINESRVSISVNGASPVVFAIPTYSNSLFDPVITTQNGLQNGLREYNGLLNLVVAE